MEEVFFANSPQFRKSGEVTYAFGQTRAGRYLFIVFKHLSRGRAQVITARAMDQTEKRYYKKRRGL
ncbi:hypothetical protein HYR54_06050 [Candidatus Acetothermia bacterium]|nr:hypothetical protein [Candidatus Acetothermia bacterium]